MSDTTQTKPEGPFAATPREELERQVMDPNVPKMEREWWAADEITRLRNELHLAQEWSARVIAGQEQDMNEITALRAEVEKLKAARDLVLEEAARCAENPPKVWVGNTYQWQMPKHPWLPNEIATAIRALKSGNDS